MSQESAYILQAVYDQLQRQSPDIVGRLELKHDVLTACDGQMLLKAEVHLDAGSHPSIAHCHIIAQIGRTSLTDPLDACVIGIHPDRQEGLAQTATNWMTNAGCTLFSLIHAKPLLGATHFDGTETWSVPGCHGFAGPLFGFGFGAKEPLDLSPVRSAGVFDYAAAMAPAGMVHLAKVVLQAKSDKTWTRSLEIDGHSACFREERWDAGIVAPANTVVGQFTVFHYGGEQDVVGSRKRLDEAIRRYTAFILQTRDLNQAASMLTREGFESDIIHRVAAFVPLAFCRVTFGDVGAKISSDYHRVKTDGSRETQKLEHFAVC